MLSCGIRRAHADENGPGHCSARSAKRLDRGALPGPFHSFTVSKSGRDSLPTDSGMQRHRLSRFEKGTIVHLWRLESSIGYFAIDLRYRLKPVNCCDLDEVLLSGTKALFTA
jgi:hypothetical protein